MFLLLFLNNAKLRDEYTSRFITSGIIARWIDLRKNVYLPFIVFWAAIRIFSIFLAFIPAALGDPTGPDVCGASIQVSKSVNLAAIVTLILLTTVALLYDLYDMVAVNTLDQSWKKIYTQTKGRKVVHYFFYRGVETILNCVLLVMCLNKVIWYSSGKHLPIYLAQVLFVTMVSCSVWSLLFFAQLVPFVGTFVMATQRMLHSLAKFGVIILIFVLPFGFIFPKFISQNADGSCPDEFNSLISSFYTSFTIILNMIDFRTFDAPSKESLWLVHVLYIIFVAILLLNFLIAIFSDEFTEITSHPKVITSVQWLSIMAIVDFRIPRCMRLVVKRLKNRYFFIRENRLYVKDLRSC